MEEWDEVLDKQLLELPILGAAKVKGSTHEYNGKIHRNNHKVCSYEEPWFAWFVRPIDGLRD